MLALPKRVDYAFRGIYCLAKSGRTLHVRDISDMENMPAASLAKIFQALVQRGVLASIRGRWGGFQLAMPPERITLARIFEALEGAVTPECCPFHDENCPRQGHCVLFKAWQQATERMYEALDAVTVRDLIEAENRKALHHAPHMGKPQTL